jgi:dienelactone hydrolase
MKPGRMGLSLFLFFCLAHAQSLPDTKPLELSGDPARQMIDGISAWLSHETEASLRHRKPTRDRLRSIIGAVDPRVEFTDLDLVATTGRPAKLADGPSYSIYAVRWPVLEGITAEGLLFEPARIPVARIVALPDADQPPEEAAFAHRLAESGYQILALTLIDRKDTWSGNPRFRMTNQPHREFIYRMAFPVGRHIIGYEVQKVLAAVDWFSKQKSKAPIGVWGYGEGGLLALYSAALDSRIDAAVVSGYFQSRQDVWKEPIYRNVWSLLRDFGDAELAGLMAPRPLIVETKPGPRIEGPPPADAKRRGAAPGSLAPPAAESMEQELDRARRLGAQVRPATDAKELFLHALGSKPAERAASPRALARVDASARMHRQFNELVEYTQKLVRQSEARREEYWSKADLSSPERWQQSTKPYREHIWDEVIGRLPAPRMALNPRTRRSYTDHKWDGYEVVLDLLPDVFTYGVLLVPKDVKPGEQRPVVVCQHGLDGRPQNLFGQPEIDRANNAYTPFHFYQNIGSRLADLGFIVYLPQNPYISDFRFLQRKANPLKLSMFSFILSQNERVLDWLSTLPFVDPRRIGFYGLSYGGKTALRVPPLLDRYALSICSGDFNEWIVKLTTVDAPFSYMFTHEYEMGEWNLAHVANHAELARLMAPRPFMVERGHRDGVGVDEWVAYEYAKVQRFYEEMGLGARTRIEYFNGPHRINGKGTIDFLQQFLGTCAGCKL